MAFCGHLVKMVLKFATPQSNVSQQHPMSQKSGVKSQRQPGDVYKQDKSKYTFWKNDMFIIPKESLGPNLTITGRKNKEITWDIRKQAKLMKREEAEKCSFVYTQNIPFS